MTGRTKRKRARPPFGRPRGVVLLATPDGWRHNLLTAEGAMVCGRLPEVPVDAAPEEARAAAAALVRDLARRFHGADVDVTWEPPRGPGSWTGRVVTRDGGVPAG
jgi:hypothetical protein